MTYSGEPTIGGRCSGENVRHSESRELIAANFNHTQATDANDLLSQRRFSSRKKYR